MQVRELHAWDVTPAEARQIQESLRGQLVLRDTLALDDIHYVAGADNGYARRGAATTAYAVVVVLTFPALELVETRTASCPVSFPYVPGLLSFREGPAVLAAFRQLTTQPDAVLFDAQGLAHPRRFGAAAHLGLLLDLPSVGCAKSRLVGRYTEPGPEFGDQAPLYDGDEVIGAVVRTRAGKAPLFVSQGHKVSLESAVALALDCSRGRSIMPEPTRLADKLVREAKLAGEAARAGGSI
jgi:deoxyribonuclease V